MKSLDRISKFAREIKLKCEDEESELLTEIYQLANDIELQADEVDREVDKKIQEAVGEVSLEDFLESDIKEQYFINCGITESMNDATKVGKFFTNINQFSLEDFEQFLKSKGAVFI